ncbi:GIN domain-containing protein [Flagellimonas sp.]|uniref:GIN domain-containing protein n=1 Tax=Flagellimonas sp. TaxID=2058762 RepID=UPI003B50C219
MKKSNLILLGALGIALFFSLVFQLSVHSNVKKEKANEVPVEIISESRTIPYFEGIKAKNRVKITFRQSTASKVVVNAPNYIIDSVSTTVIDKQLSIEVSKKLRKRDSILIQIDQPALTHLTLNNDAHFETIGSVSGENLHLEFKDESSANLNLSYDFVKYLNNTKGEINLQGEIKKIDLIANKEQ